MDMQELITDPQQVFEQLNLPPEYLAAMGRILAFLQYPVAPDDSVFDVSFAAAVVAYHLSRCGFDIVRTPLIKKREVSGPGIVMGACHWVDAAEDNSPLVYRSPLDDVENMTLAEINALPESLKREAYARLGLPYEEPEWTRGPAVNIEEAPEPDGAEWTTHD